MNQSSNPEENFEAVSKLIDGAEETLVATHKNPDGDAVGSLLGMSSILTLMGKRHTVFCPDGIPKTFRFLTGVERAVKAIDGQHFDLTLLFDTSDRKLLPKGFPDASARGTWVVVDHHRHFEAMGDLCVRKETSSVGELIFEMARQQGWPLDRAVAECLYTSLVSDTSSFKYESATAACHLAAAALIELGAEPWRVASELFESFSLTRQRLLGKVLDTLEMSHGGRFASLVCTQAALREAGAVKADLDGMVNFARAVEGVALAALFSEEENGDVKVSLRSKGEVDASLVALELGGGGHVNAAGCVLSGVTVEEAVRQVRKAADPVLLIHK
jgi:phosphoesterase RecJ-like protein